MGLYINGVAVFAGTFSVDSDWTPSTSDGAALGTTTKMWSDLFLASAAVVNFNNGNMTVTHAAGKITVAGGTLNLAGNLVFDSALDLAVPAATAAAFELSDGTTKFYAVDTRVAVVGVTTHTFNISNYTLASAANAVATGVSIAAHTLNLTGTTQVTSAANTLNIGARTIAGDTATITVDQANAIRLAAPTEGTNVAITFDAAIRILNAGGTPVNHYGIFIEDLTAGATNDVGIYIAGADTAAIWAASADPIRVGLASTGTGKIEFVGTTSGTVTLSVADAAGTWTMKLPTAVGGAGEQLTDAAGNGVTSWAAAGSLSRFKNVFGLHSRQDALDKMLGVRVVDFQYKQGPYDERGEKIVSTGDHETRYTGVLGDEAPWAMHFGGKIFNPVSAFGYTVAAMQAMFDRIQELEGRLSALNAN